MPTVTLSDLVGPSNALASPNVDLEQTINLFVESTQPGNAKVPKWLRKRPCFRPFGLFSGSPGRGTYTLNGRAWGVAGTVFGEIHADGSITEYGTPVTDDADHSPCSFISNGTAGNQVALTGGLDGFVLDTLANTFGPITDPDFPNGSARQMEFVDGYGFVSIIDSRRFQFSALEDLTSWDALDVAERSIAADNIVGIKRRGRDLGVFGSQTSEFWYNTGDALTPFQPSQGVLIEQGASAAFAIERCDNTLMFPVQDARGTGIVSLMDGYQNVRATSYAIDRLIQSSASLDRAVAFSFQMDGHLFYVLQGVNFSNAEGSYTPVYDVLERLWYLWAQWNSTTCLWEPLIVNSHIYCFGTHLFGSLTNGYIYEGSLAFLEDRIVP